MPRLPSIAARQQRRDLIAAALLLLLTALNFLPSLRFPLLNDWDDHFHLVANAHLDFTFANLRYWWAHPMLGIYMPVTMYSYLADHLCWGLNPLGYRLQSLFWHLIMVFLVFRCFRACGLKTAAAWLAAAVFAVHPQRLESVAWISERKDVMCGAFYFAAVYCYLTGPWERRFRPGVLLLTFLALLCKPMAVSLPLIFLLADYARGRREKPVALLLRCLPYLAATAAIAILTLFTQPSIDKPTTDWGRQALVVLHNFYWYTVHTVLPPDPMPIYPRITFSPGTVAAMVLFYAAGAAAVLAALLRPAGRARRWREFAPPLLAYAVALTPVVGVFQLGFIDYADRYSYIPSVFLLFFLALLLQRVCRTPFRRRLVCVLAAIYLIRLLYVSADGLDAWSSFERLLDHSSRPADPNEIVLIERGFRAVEAQNHPLALGLAARLEKEAPVRRREYGWRDGVFYAGMIRMEAAYAMGHTAEADRLLAYIYPALKPAVYYKPGLQRLILRRTISAAMRTGDLRAANEAIDRLLRQYSATDRDFIYYYYRGLQYGFAGDLERAEADFSAALKLNPGDPSITGNLELVRKRRQAERRQP